MKIIVVGSCQAAGFANCLRLLIPTCVVETRGPTGDMADLSSSDVILLQATIKADFANLTDPGPRIVRWPIIVFNGFHPDIIILSHQVLSPTGGWHSAICVAAWKEGLTPAQTVSLFRRDVFHRLGYFDYFERAKKALVTHLDEYGFPGDRLVKKWCGSGCFMYGVNHPRLHVLADLAREMTKIMGFPPAIENPEDFVIDNMLLSACWPAFPPLSDAFDIKSGPKYQFKGRNSATGHVGAVYDLRGFIEASYEIYSEADSKLLHSVRLQSSAYQNLKSLVRDDSARPESGSPYKGLPDYQYWRRAVEKTGMKEVDPVVAGQFKIEKSDKIATAGSCFAQHISRALSSCGFSYYVAEDAPPNMDSAAATTLNYGTFSARYGNIYTARQLLQLFDRAYGNLAPFDVAWIRPDGRWADAFRPAIDPNGFETAEDVSAAMRDHLAFVRRMFETLDVFVFTLGLTEAWRSRLDGAVFPLAPGVVAGAMDFDRYEFVNFGVSETVDDLNAFIVRLRSVNPRAKIILTVSPVPLIATYEKRHVLVSTTYSKSVLRVGAEEATRAHESVAYFPSYELITGNFNRGAYFEDDLRTVRPEGVEHVMSLFLKHFCGSSAEPVEMKERAESASASAAAAREIQALREVVCDESWMDV